MREKKRLACLLLALLTALCLTPRPSRAAGQVYFLAVNEQIFALEDETMPFWSGGVLYVPSIAFSDNDLGITYARLRDKTGVLLSQQRYGVVVCDFGSNTIYDNSSGQLLGGSAITRRDTVFLPLDVICRFFGLSYSYTRVTYGYLIRIKNGSVQLQDSQFIDAAGIAMANRYARYERSHAAPAEAESAAPAAPASPAPVRPQTQQTQKEEEPEEPARTVYLILEATAPETALRVLAQLGAEDAVFLFSPGALEGMDDLLRRLVAGGGAAALRADGSAGAEAALRQLEEGNRFLWNAASVKTRLALLDGASEDTARAVAAAGYCLMDCDVDYSGSRASQLGAFARVNARILSAADRRGGVCRVLLGRDEDVLAAGNLPVLLASLRSVNCAFARLSEVTA